MLAVALLCGAVWAAPAAAPAAKQVEYQRADTNFYWKGDVLKADSKAVILPLTSFAQNGASYMFTPKTKAPKEIYVQVVNDWVEPITPPDMPASLQIASDEMQIREPQGDVTVALPSAPANFVPATPNMVLPNGSVVKTGGNGSAAVLFGGFASARLIPNSEAAVQQTVTDKTRATEIDLTKGAVFSKVGTIIGVAQDYKVKTPFGVAAARGTDFVTIALPARTDVWIAAGTVQMDKPDGKLVGTVKSDDSGALKIVRNPPMPDAKSTMMASAETMTAAMDIIPMINVKLKALRDKMAQGVALTPNEKDYLARIKQVPCLIKLELFVPPLAPPANPPPAAAPAPGAAAAPAPANVLELAVRPDGKVDFQGATLTLDDLKAKLADLGKTTPDQPILIKNVPGAPKGQTKKVMGLAKAAKLTKVTIDKPTPAGAMPKPVAPAPVLAPQPVPAPAAAPVAAASAPANALEIVVRPDGKVDFQGATLSLDELKPKLDAIAASTPDQPILVKRNEKLQKGQLRAVSDLCKAEKLTKVTIDHTPLPGQPPKPGAPPVPAPAPAAAAPEAPTPPPAKPQLPPAMELPMNIELRHDGKVHFGSETLTLNQLKTKLHAIAKTTPEQPLLVQGRDKVSSAQLKKVLAVCETAKLKNVTVAPSWPQQALVASTGSGLMLMPLNGPSPANESPAPRAKPAAAPAPTDYSEINTRYTVP